MQLMSFDTAVAPAESRLSTFREAAREFQIDALGDPADFVARWRLLKLGDLNVIRSWSSELRYQRTPEAIAADGQDRITLHYYLSGGEVGRVGDHPVRVAAGGAVVWDLAVPLDICSLASAGQESVILTLPRHMAAEVLSTPELAGPVAPSQALTLAVKQALHLIDHADQLSEAAAVFLGRALRDMFAVAILADREPASSDVQKDAPLLRRVISHLDETLSQTPDLDRVASALGEDARAVAEATEQVGGLPVLIERRRLLAAYRMLCEPGETDTIEVIAHRCGFNSLPRFSDRFRSVFRTSARDLRRFGRGHLPRWAGAYHVEQIYGALRSA